MDERAFSYSKILNYATCPMLYYFKNIAHIQPVKKAKPLSLGNCMSQALRAYRLHGTLEAAEKGFMETWVEDGKILRIKEDPDNPKDFRTVTRAIEILEEYVNVYPNDPKMVVSPEVSFEIEGGKVKGKTIIFNGRIDGVISDEQGNTQIIEDKNVSSLGPAFFVTLSGSLQIGLYLYAADQYGLFNVGGRKTTPQCLMSAVRFHPKEARFERDITIKSRTTLNFFKENALRWVDRILTSEEDNVFPLNDVDNSTCKRYGGCDYLPLKYTKGSVRKALLKKIYVKTEKIDGRYVTSPIEDTKGL